MQLLDKTVEMRGSQILNMQAYEAVVCQRRFMAVTTAFAWLSVITLLVALATCSWCHIEFKNKEDELVHVQLGTWGEWRTRTNESTPNVHIVDWIQHFPSPPEHIPRLADHSIRHFHRAQVAVGALSLLLLISTNTLAIYTFTEHRYMYKRLCAILYVITGVVVYSTVETISKSVDEWKKDVVNSKHTAFDFDAEKELGYSAYLAISVVVVCFLAAIAFAYGSHKQKGENAATYDCEMEDRPMHYGR